jgi:hypothetical protein
MKDLKRFRVAMMAIAVACGSVSVVRAAPPTAVPSPGYDARLQEQHAAMSRVDAPVAAAPVQRRHVRRKH